MNEQRYAGMTNRQPRAPGEVRRFFMIYNTPAIASIAAATGTATNTINFAQDSSFVWIKSVFFCDLAGAAVTSGARIIPLVNLQITEQGSGQSYFDSPTPLQSLAGDSGSLPFILPAPQLIAPNTTLVFSWSNYSAATAYANLRLQMIGWKVYNDER